METLALLEIRQQLKKHYPAQCKICRRKITRKLSVKNDGLCKYCLQNKEFDDFIRETKKVGENQN